jgi:hypothetical protein
MCILLLDEGNSTHRVRAVSAFTVRKLSQGACTYRKDIFQYSIYKNLFCKP